MHQHTHIHTHTHTHRHRHRRVGIAHARTHTHRLIDKVFLLLNFLLVLGSSRAFMNVNLLFLSSYPVCCSLHGGLGPHYNAGANRVLNLYQITSKNNPNIYNAALYACLYTPSMLSSLLMRTTLTTHIRTHLQRYTYK